jgi:preprotein translocase subunit YajC
MENEITEKLIKNVALSLLIYALPILLMFATFYFTGERPWKKNLKQNELTTTKHTIR